MNLRVLFTILPLVLACRAPRDAEPRSDAAANAAPRLPATPADEAPPDSAPAIYFQAMHQALGQRGELLDSTAAPTPNIHVQGQVDTNITLRYRNLTVSYYAAPQALLLTHLTVTMRLREMPYDLGVGSPAHQVVAGLGWPQEDRLEGEVRKLRYAVGEAAHDYLTFILRRDTVFAVEWAPYID